MTDTEAAAETGQSWVARFAEALDIAPPTDEEFEILLNLAGVAAHASERIAAPIACWLSARADVSPTDALTIARSL